MVAAELAMLSIAHPIAGMVAVVWFLRCYVQLGRWQQQQREDKHYADVRAWREHADEQTVTLRPVVVIARSPLLDEPVIERAEAAGRAAEQAVAATQEYRPGRHRLQPGQERSALMRALTTKTQAMFVGVLTAAGETPPDTFGPPEPMLRRIVWHPSQPEVWRQESLLEIEAS